MDLREVQSRGEIISTNRHPWEIARVELVKRLLKKYKNELKGKVILDIGCGDTFVVESLSNYFSASQFYAIDIAFSDELLDSYRLKLKDKKISLFTSLDDALGTLGDKQIGGILLLDVIEHIKDDVAFMKDLYARKEIDNDVKIMITVPAFQGLFTSHDTFLGHYRRYTNKMLKRHINESGFESIELGYFFVSLIPIRVLQWVKEKIIKKSAESNTGLVSWEGSRLSSSLLKSMMLMDFSITNSFKKIGIKIPGLSNYAICKKSV